MESILKSPVAYVAIRKNGRREVMRPKVKEALNKILERFESGDIPEAVAYSIFPIPNLPCSHWSLINRTLVFISGSMDARGIKQWNSVNRFVKPGTKAIYILVPFIRNVEDDLGKNQHRLLGFGVAPVFRVEDTEGEALLNIANKSPCPNRRSTAHCW
jgi:hypothetical protein